LQKKTHTHTQYKHKFLKDAEKKLDRYSIIGRVLFKDLTGKPSMAITQASSLSDQPQEIWKV